MTLYKVVRIKNGRMFSCCASGKYRLEYITGKITKKVPDTPGIMCFKTKKRAKEYVLFLNYYLGINNCRVVRVDKIGPGSCTRKICKDFSEKKITQYLNGEHNSALPPRGTILVDAVEVLPTNVAYKVTHFIFKDKKYYSCSVQGKYELEYRKGSLVKSIAGTIGIMCFSRKYDAKNFICPNTYYKIKKVEVIEKLANQENIAGGVEESLIDDFYRNKAKCKLRKTPRGTIFCQYVRVLE